MTKKELFDALHDVPDDAKILIDQWGEGMYSLYEINYVYVFPDHTAAKLHPMNHLWDPDEEEE